MSAKIFVHHFQYGGDNLRILVVEDDKALSMVLCELLGQEGYTIDSAYNGEDGYDCAASGIYDVIILDVMIPKMDGFTVLKNLRNDHVGTPVLMLTAKSQIEDKVTGLDCGADDYLTKPFNSSELLARVRALARRKASEFVDTSVRFKDIVINKDVHEISKDEHKVKLTKKEFDILDVMMRSRGKVVSKDTLTLKIWGYDSDIEYNSCEVYVSFLRKKLKAIRSDIRIATVRGIGYILEDTNESGS